MEKREIKFRAWDKEKKVMYYDVQDGTSLEDGSFYTFDEILNSKIRFAVMEYIGLKDVNGREIYEGDNLVSKQTHTISRNTGKRIRNGHNSNKIVAWRFNHSGVGFNVVDKHTWKVVGNIFED